MERVPVDKIRNIGFMAHIDAGKTTTTERILYYSGVTYKMGEVHDGTAVMDYMDQEQERGITITSASTTCYWKENKINVIDTPGHVDFTAEVERSLRVLDGAIIILSGVEGVEPQTEKVWYQASKYEIPRIVYINKMDRVGADYNMVVDQIESKLDAKTLLIQLPLGIENDFEGVIDLITMKSCRYSDDQLGSNYKIEDIPGKYLDEVEIYRDNLIEKLADYNLEIMELFLEKKDIPENLIKKTIRNITLDLEGVPVLMGSSFKNKAVQNLLDAIISYLPSPIDKGDVVGYLPRNGKKVHRKLSNDEPFSALVFKISIDFHVGQLIFFRVYSGTIKRGSYVYNSNKKKRFRILKLLKMHANKREEVEEVYSGDIAATVGLSGISTGDTLCDERQQIVLDTIIFPEPVVSATIEPKLTSDHDKLDSVLSKLSCEDPTLKVKFNQNTGQNIISGMGELHLEVVQERIKRDFKMRTKMGKPRVAYHETIRQKAIGEGKYIKQSGGKAQYGHVVVEISPFKGDKKFKFSTKIKSNVIPKEFFKAIEIGVVESMDMGFLAGFPIMNVEATLIDGSWQEEDSTDLAFKIAASMAFKNAFRKAKPILLEPIMKIEILVQEEYLGEVIGDFNSREGKITKMDNRSILHVIDGLVPLSNMFGYATALRTLSQGRANYSMEFNNYEEMSESKMNDILKNQLGIYTFN